MRLADTLVIIMEVISTYARRAPEDASRVNLVLDALKLLVVASPEDLLPVWLVDRSLIDIGTSVGEEFCNWSNAVVMLDVSWHCVDDEMVSGVSPCGCDTGRVGVEFRLLASAVQETTVVGSVDVGHGVVDGLCENIEVNAVDMVVGEKTRVEVMAWNWLRALDRHCVKLRVLGFNALGQGDGAFPLLRVLRRLQVPWNDQQWVHHDLDHGRGTSIRTVVPRFELLLTFFHLLVTHLASVPSLVVLVGEIPGLDGVLATSEPLHLPHERLSHLLGILEGCKLVWHMQHALEAVWIDVEITLETVFVTEFGTLLEEVSSCLADSLLARRVDEEASHSNGECWEDLDSCTSDNTKGGTTSTTESPEQVWVVACRNLVELAISSDNLDFNNIVDLETELVGERIVASSLEPTTNNGDTLFWSISIHSILFKNLRYVGLPES
jgi:hypothetical protein